MSDHLPDVTKMVDRIPCEKCGEFHTVEVNVATFQGVINECSKLQARVEELEAENKHLAELAEIYRQGVNSLDERITSMLYRANIKEETHETT